MYNPIQQVLDLNLDVRLKIFYFTLEIPAEEKMLYVMSNILYMKEGLRISPKDLKSTKADRPLPEEVLEKIQKYKPYFDKIEECVEFIDGHSNPYGIYSIMRKYALDNGKIHKRTIQTNEGPIEVEDYYEPNDPDEYVMCIVDNINLIKTERDVDTGRTMDKYDAIGKLSSDYLIKLRNRFGYIPVIIQQQANAQESVENKKYNRLKPSCDGLADNKSTSKDANVVFGLFSPFRHEIPEYLGYDTKVFRDNIRFLEIIAGRDGGGGATCPLFFDGAVNYFKELPLPNEHDKMQMVTKYLQSIR